MFLLLIDICIWWSFNQFSLNMCALIYALEKGKSKTKISNRISFSLDIGKIRNKKT